MRAGARAWAPWPCPAGGRRPWRVSGVARTSTQRFAAGPKVPSRSGLDLASIEHTVGTTTAASATWFAGAIFP